MKIKAFILIVIISLAVLTLLTLLPLRTPIKSFIVLSGSMRPSIREGSLIFVKRGNDNLKKTDIITFINPLNPRQNVTHRITDINIKDKKIIYKTKGDANKKADNWTVAKEAVWGEIIFSAPLLGYLINFTKSKLGSFVLIVLPIIFIIIDEIKIIYLEIKKLQRKKSKKRKKLLIPKTLILFISVFYFFSNVSAIYAAFSESVSSGDQKISTGCWQLPGSLALIAPPNNTFINVNDMDFNWDETVSDCLVAALSYKLQVFLDSSLTNLYEESSWDTNVSYTVSDIDEGNYWWRVLAKDQYNNISSSETRYLTIDKSPPSASLLVNGSWTKSIEEKLGDNGGFEMSDYSSWTSAGDVSVLSSDTIDNPSVAVSPTEGDFMARIGSPDNPGNWTWENRLMKSFDSGTKSFSLDYNYFSRDISGFDSPGFFIRLNGQQIFQQDSLNSDGIEALNTDWQRFYYDLSDINTDKINLGIYAGNTGDKNQQSWVYIDRVTTYLAASSSYGEYSLVGSDFLSGIHHLEYKIYKENESEPENWLNYSSPFNIPETGNNYLKYKAVDNAGNAGIYLVKIIIDDQAPSAIDDLNISDDNIDFNNVVLGWTAKGNDGSIGRASKYDIRYLTNCDNPADFNFGIAYSVDKVPSPKDSGNSEQLEITGLDPGANYCFGIKVGDEAPNWSDLSNVVTITTLYNTDINYGDIVINEMMWMGSSVSSADEWLELRNMTGHDIDLTGFYLTKLDQSSEAVMNINLTGKKISPHSYFLVANSNSYAGGQSRLNVTPNIWDSSLDLSDDTLQIRLYSPAGNIIDIAWDGTVPAEGFFDSLTERYYSMERISIPGDGSNPLSWYTAIDEASTADFFDGGMDERGTPGSQNRSENEPLAHQKLIIRILPVITQVILKIATDEMSINQILITPTPAILPEISLNFEEIKSTLSFKVINLKDFVKLNYELIYDSDSGEQGIVGSNDIQNQNEFIKENIFLGTCSGGGTCIYHTGIKNIKLKINLEDKTGKLNSLMN